MRSQLGALGFVWDATTKGQWWPESFVTSESTWTHTGDRHPPQKIPSAPADGRKLTPTQINQIDVLGFVWDLRNQKKDNTP